ncbi:MAG: protein-disulfide reductase DsbD [Acidiferrobacterales bacterium]|nr:protein-disulfide reductase DsbD [Acidiferrobacterales bacterium]
MNLMTSNPSVSLSKISVLSHSGRRLDKWCKGISRWCAILLLLPLGVLAQSGAEELLPEDEAFAFSATLLPDNQLEAVWTIAPGYYMYRDKFSFAVEGDAQLAKEAELPRGKEKFDELFGDVEVYLDRLALILDLKASPTGGTFNLLVGGQGCNEPVGVCYPPIKHTIGFDLLTTATNNLSSVSTASPSLAADGLVEFAGMDTSSKAISQRIQENLSAQSDPAATATTPSDTANQDAALPDSVSALRDLLSAGFEQPEYLAVEDAFQLTMSVADEKSVTAEFEVAEGYYLYKKQMKFTRNGTPLSTVSLPEGEIKNDEYFGEAFVFRNAFTVPVELARTSSAAEKITVEATYQGCADEGICYPPVTEKHEFTFPSFISDAIAQSDNTPDNSASSDSLNPNEDTTRTSGSKTLLGLLIGAFFAGLLLTFTPCVLPLIPILSSVIAGQGENVTRARGGSLAVIYVLGTAVTYAGMGALAGATGEQLQAYFQNIWAIGALAIIFLIMALSMFGLFELQLPSAIQSRLQNSTQNLSGSVIPVFVLGLVSALIVGACVSPVLISFLGVAVSKADPYLGAQLMFVMALGMGVPLIALGFGAGYLIPRAGRWMETIKHLFGIMLIGVAIYMLGVLPDVPVLLLWGVFFIVLSVYLGATQSLPEGGSGWLTFQKGVGTVLLVWGVFALLGGFFGQRDLIRPLPANLFSPIASGTPSGHEGTENVFQRVSNPEAFSAKLDAAKAEGRKVVIDFYADWCVDCIKMEKATFNDQQVVAELESDYIALQIDVTDPGDIGTSTIKKQLGVFGPPAVLFFDENGMRQKQKDFYGFKKPQEFLALLTSS